MIVMTLRCKCRCLTNEKGLGLSPDIRHEVLHLSSLRGAPVFMKGARERSFQMLAREHLCAVVLIDIVMLVRLRTAGAVFAVRSIVHAPHPFVCASLLEFVFDLVLGVLFSLGSPLMRDRRTPSG